MVVRFAEGFDDVKDWTTGGVGNTEILQVFQNRSGSQTKFWESGGRFGNGYLEIGDSSWVRANIDPTGALGMTTIYASIAFKLESFGVKHTIFRGLSNTAAGHGSIEISTVGAIKIYDSAGALKATSLGLLTADTWHFIEIELVIANPGSLTVRVDQGPSDSTTYVSDTTGDYEAATGTLDVRFVDLVSGAGTGLRFDDFVIADDSGSFNNSWIGDHRLIHLRPTSDVTTDYTPSSGTDHFALVDETPWDDTDYIESTTVTDKDSFGFGNLPNNPDSVNFLYASAHVKKSDAGGTKLKQHIKAGATTSTSAAKTLVTDFKYYKEYHDFNPDTSAAWGNAEVDSIEGGVEVA